jgi:hypothetical protein
MYIYKKRGETKTMKTRIVVTKLLWLWSGRATTQAVKLLVVVVYALTATIPNLIGVERVEAAWSTVEQAGFRFIGNFDAQDPRNIVSNHSANDDRLIESVIDPINGFMYAAGHSTTWIIEKRRLRDGALETSFGTNGILTVSITGSTLATVGGLALNLQEGALYIAGDDNSLGAANAQWRIEKRNMDTGALISGFGTGGVVTTNPTAGNDSVNEIIIDNITGHLIAGGYDSSSGNGWWIEKRTLSTGALDTGFGTNGIITYNPSGRPEMVSAMAVDEGGGYFYVTGVDDGSGNTRWRVEKRRINTGALCTAAECGTVFGTGGIYTDNPTNGSDQPLTIQVDIAGNALYFAGYDNGPGGGGSSRRWRIVKVDALTGTHITAFGTNGVISSDPSSGLDESYQVALDGKGGYLYIIGTDRTSSDLRWRIEKRNRGDGSLVTTWGTSGAITINPSANSDEPQGVMVDVDRGVLIAAGEDRGLGTANSQWRYELFQLDTGDRWLAAQDVISIASTKVSFRLRMLLHVSANDLIVSDAREFKLQYAFKVGTCDTGFVGEQWADISTGTGDIRFHDNPTTTDGQTMLAVTGDPVHSGHTTVLQSIEESHHFTAGTNVPIGQDGMWDFVIRDAEAFGAYCFRVVNSDGSLLDSYSVIPEISFCKDDPRAENVMRHGTFFCEGTKRAFFWAQ